MEEFEKLASEALQLDMGGGVADATGVPDVPETQSEPAGGDAEPAQLEASSNLETMAGPEQEAEEEIAREKAAGD
jgi:hypothetical protein